MYSGTIVRQSKTLCVFVASPIIVCAEGSNGDHVNPHLRLKVQASDGTWNALLLARTSLVGGGNWQVELLRHGSRIGDPDTLLNILKTVRAPEAFTLFEKAGWNGASYVLPNGEVIGPDNQDADISFKPLKGYGPTGTKEEADARIFKLCENNSRLELNVCASLAAPFLKDTGVEPGGFHIYGPSTSGKTTATRMGASVWGSGADAVDGGTVGSWRGTDNGVEGDAAAHNDGLFTRSELKECKPMAVQQVIYMLGNGKGKQTMTRNRDVRDVLTFRTMVLSDGELSTREHIEGDSSLSYDAGAAARIHDIPADAGKCLGVFEDLHGAAGSKEFAEQLTSAASECFGHHGRALLEHLISNREHTVTRVRVIMDNAYAQYTNAAKISGADQEGRVVKRFALCAAVGELAIELGILPWQKGSAIKGAHKCFMDWFDARGKGSIEAIAAHRAFSEFIFSNPAAGEFGRDRKFIVSQNEDGYFEYWFTRETLAKAVGQPQRVDPFLQHLRQGHSEEWGIVTDGDGKRYLRTVPKSIGGTMKRMVCIRSKTQQAQMSEK